MRAGPIMRDPGEGGVGLLGTSQHPATVTTSAGFRIELDPLNSLSYPRLLLRVEQCPPKKDMSEP